MFQKTAGSRNNFGKFVPSLKRSVVKDGRKGGKGERKEKS